jgi:RNA polymerase sigma-70 factor (ECF subfamily)
VSRLVELVRAAVPEREIPDTLEPLLVERIASARVAWSSIHVDDQQFLRAIAHRLSIEDPARALEAMHTDDLYLVCGCAVGDPAALAGFESCCGPTIARAIATSGASVAERADLGQVVRQRLLVARPDGGMPRIATYAALGTLQTWVRVIAIREAVRMLPMARREVAASDEEILGMVCGADAPEVGYFKRLYREEFKRAFHAAVEALNGRDRLVLQQHALDGLGIDQLAVLHGVHRATAARWVQAARDAVLTGTQRVLIRRLRLSHGELASVIRLIRSQLDLSLPRVLRAPHDACGSCGSPT